MRDPWTIKLNTTKKECCDDNSKKHLVNCPHALHEKVLSNHKWNSCCNDENKFFKHAPGKTIQTNNPEKRIKQQKKLNLFGDKDKDKVMNILDSHPYNKKKKGGFNIKRFLQ